MAPEIGPNIASEAPKTANPGDKSEIIANCPKFVIGIVAHHQRAEMATKLAHQVDADIICWDDGKHVGDHVAGCAATHLTVLAELAGTTAEWACILEDDAVPAADFRKHAAKALEYAPAPVVGLYLGTGHHSSETQRNAELAVTAAQERNCGWILADCLIGSVGYAVRANKLTNMIASITDREEELPLRISRWAQARNIPICYTQPSLVDHDDSESVGRPWRGPGFPARRAWSHGTRKCWCTGSVTLGHCPVWSAPA